MAQPSNGVFPLLAGMITAAALSGAAVLVVLNSGCEDPGSYHEHDGVVELIGGCLRPSDLPVAPREPAASPPPGSSDPFVAR